MRGCGERWNCVDKNSVREYCRRTLAGARARALNFPGYPLDRTVFPPRHPRTLREWGGTTWVLRRAASRSVQGENNAEMDSGPSGSGVGSPDGAGGGLADG